MHRHNDGTAPLCGGDNSRLELPPRSPRPIRRKRDWPSGVKLSNSAKQCPSTAPGAGAWDRPVTQGVGKFREVSAFSRFTDHDGNALMPVVPEQGE
jgi:hypothetical protein